MVELRLGEDVLEKLNITKERAEILARQLHGFIDTHFQNWDDHQSRMNSTTAKKGEIMEEKKWNQLLGVLSPNDLPDQGVGQIFLVAWSHSGYGEREQGRIPMEIWLAKGENVDNRIGIGVLNVQFFQIGTMRHGQSEIDINKEFGRGVVRLDSTVIIDPRQD